jgi:excisionase family DNA binding protein
LEPNEQTGEAPERWYTIKQIVEALNVHEQTVRQWIKDGLLPAKLFGRRGGYRIRASDYEAFLDAWPGTGKAAA